MPPLADLVDVRDVAPEHATRLGDEVDAIVRGALPVGERFALESAHDHPEIATLLRRGVKLGYSFTQELREGPFSGCRFFVESLTPPVQLLGPKASLIERVNRRVRWQMLIRASSRPPLRWLLRQLRPRLGDAGSGEFKTMANVDVDPQSLI